MLRCGAARACEWQTGCAGSYNPLQQPTSTYNLPAVPYPLPRPAEEEAAGDGFEEDAADREARRRAAAEAARLAELRKRSQVMQRGLPRPAALDLLPQPRPEAALAKLSARELAEEMLLREYSALIAFEAARFPDKPAKGSGKGDKAAAAVPADVPPIEQVCCWRCCGPLLEALLCWRAHAGWHMLAGGSAQLCLQPLLLRTLIAWLSVPASSPSPGANASHCLRPLPPPCFACLQYEEAELAAASELLRAEAEFVRGAMGHGELAAADYSAAWEAVAKDIIYVPAQQRYTRAASATNADRVASVQAEFEGVRREMEKEAKRAAKLEARVGVVTGGLVERQDKLRGEAEEAWGALRAAGTELQCFRWA